jgi:heptosyltransferase III
LPPGRWLSFAPAVALASKAWPVANYISLANALSDIFTGVILDGSPQEREITEAVAKGLKIPYVNLAGKTSLLQAAAILTRAHLFVGSDSGLGHVASAVGTPTLTLFSNDTPVRVLPWGKRSAYLCSDGANAGSIRVEDVLKMVRTLVVP